MGRRNRRTAGRKVGRAMLAPLLACAALMPLQMPAWAGVAAASAVRFCDLSELTPRNVRGLMALATAEPRLVSVRYSELDVREPVAATSAGPRAPVGTPLGYRIAERPSGGQLTAWNPVSEQVAWSARETAPITTDPLVTAGGLLFYGTADGWLKARDARTGELLWQRRLERGPLAGPVSCRARDGHQYVSVRSHAFSLPR